MCIRTFINVDWKDLQYTALSYVWGMAGQQIMLKNENVRELEQSGSVEKRCSQTIKDAAQVTRELGLNYIWVDALCIIQDNLDDKKIQIGNMATIYRSAILTIVAAAGQDANHGLPGLNKPRTMTQKEVVEASMVTLQQIRDRIPNLTIDKLSDTPDDQLIFFWTETAFFYSGYKDHEAHDSLRRKIMGNSGKVVGELGTWPDGHVARTRIK
ncbi:hypothetical protein GTA08_BOTSDO03802 [Botryosphaeria dothidea]|uniref:Heterokaryon incompatibility domain-containing protein n=1 Tax=Botryosphaeria dothidea TaxID=55169 RepID=A0A8H4IXM8_9PEZI|nr:hypothetical protein GTA08_BOTSDO03802 [Botryosphaeria dothidea]